MNRLKLKIVKKLVENQHVRWDVEAPDGATLASTLTRLQAREIVRRELERPAEATS